MRIVYLVFGKDIAGGETVCFQIMGAARDRGHEVCLLVPAAGSTMETARAKGFEVFIFPLERTFQFYKAIAFASWLRRRRAELVHTHTVLPGMVLARLAALIAGIPIICHVHLDHVFNSQSLIGWLQRKVDNLTVHLSVTIAVSQDTRQSLIASGNAANHVIMLPNGVEINHSMENKNEQGLRQTINIPKEARIIGCVARLDPIKGQSDLISAMTSICQEKPDVHAVFVGADIASGGKLESELRAQVIRQGLSGRVHFLGFQPNASRLINDFDVFVLPSYREAMPMSILEAMAVGKPIVATTVNGIPEVVVDGVTGFLVPSGDPNALAEAILKILSDPVLARSMGQAGRARLEEHFNLEKIHTRLFDLYEQITDKRRG